MATDHPDIFFRNGARPGKIEAAALSPEAMGMVENAEATCSCGRRYYTDEGAHCPRCAYEKGRVPKPFLLRDECGGCGLPCSNEWCPYCEGAAEADQEKDVMRRQFAASVTQLTQDRALAANQLELARKEMGRTIRATEAARDIALTEAADLRRQRDLANLALAEAEERLKTLRSRLCAAADQLVTLHDTQVAARTAVCKAALTLVAIGAAAALTWATWDRLPGLARYWRGAAEVVALLGVSLLVLPRWRHGHKPEYWTMHTTIHGLQELPGGNPGTYGPDSGTASGLGPPSNASG